MLTDKTKKYFAKEIKENFLKDEKTSKYTARLSTGWPLGNAGSRHINSRLIEDESEFHDRMGVSIDFDLEETNLETVLDILVSTLTAKYKEIMNSKGLILSEPYIHADVYNKETKEFVFTVETCMGYNFEPSHVGVGDKDCALEGPFVVDLKNETENHKFVSQSEDDLGL